MGQTLNSYLPPQRPIAKKKIVIVGASYSGIILTQKLVKLDKKDSHLEILLIDKNDYFEHICTNMESLTSEEHFRRTSIKMTKLRESFRTPFVYFKRAKLTKVFDRTQMIEIEVAKKKSSSESVVENTSISKGSPKKNQGGQSLTETEVIKYDFLIICTGASYSYPIREAWNEQISLDQRVRSISSVRDRIREAKSILVVGGGANGVEYVGSLMSVYGTTEKKIGIITRGPRLLQTLPPRASEAAEKYLKRQDVFVYLNTDFNEHIRQELGYELVIDCTGYKFPGPKEFMRGDLLNCVSERSGQILVNDLLQVTSQNPLVKEIKGQKNQVFPRIFALGDVCLTKANEEKSIVPIYGLADLLAYNIKVLVNTEVQSLIKTQNQKYLDSPSLSPRGQSSRLSMSQDKPLSQEVKVDTKVEGFLHRVPDTLHYIGMITIGTQYGLVVWNDFVITGRLSPIMKRIIEHKTMDELNNKTYAMIMNTIQQKAMNTAFWFCGGKLTSCCPCNLSRRKNRQEIREAKQNYLFSHQKLQ